MAPLPIEMRQIIALDLDNFYVGCERLRDPTLVGQPVGIKQKGILATCSYEARARGVGKLMGIREAVKKCPELIIVSGEDLTPYRQHSRLVFDLVRSLVGPGCPVEKLGMDELFIDCSSLIGRHLAESLRRRGDGHIWFDLGPIGATEGFWYPVDCWAGHRLEGEDSVSGDPPDPYLVASHLAHHLRHKIQTDIGLTSSAGVSHSKLMSKLIASNHKPADQTSFSPDFLPSTSALHPASQALVQAYLDLLDLRKLAGFGSTLTSKIVASLSQLKPAPPPDFDSPTVLTTRTLLSLPIFKTLFTPRLAPILWDLLHGEDPSPVVASPEFPAQIGVEDSYAKNYRFDWPRFGAEAERLLTALLVRLEEELVVVDKSSGKRKWVRWPEKLKMEIRRGWDEHGREGKSVGMPVGVFDLGVEVEERVRMLMGRKATGLEEGSSLKKVGGVVGSLMRGLVKEGDDKEFDLYVINFAAVSLSTHAPGPSIATWTRSSSSTDTNAPSKGKHKASRPDIDLSVLDALPASLRAEVLASYGLSEQDVAEMQEEERSKKRRKVDRDVTGSGAAADEEEEAAGLVPDMRELQEEGWQASDEGHSLEGDSDAEGEDDGDGGDETDGEDGTCEVCGKPVLAFARAAHALFHAESD